MAEKEWVMNIAIVLCCYNRKELTKRCLSQLRKQASLLLEDNIEFFICDDKSDDGTFEMIEKEFPEMHLYKSEGNLYWCKSMYLVMQEARKQDFDLYLMVNDDVSFVEEALKIMLESYKMVGKSCGIVGTTRNPQVTEPSYGGRDSDGMLLVPNSELQKCIWANWNCFLIDREVVEKIGIIDGKYQHSWGDYDYSHRMQVQNIPLFIATEYIGECQKNSKTNTFGDAYLKKSIRLKKLFSPKGQPIYSYMRYHIRVYGKSGILKYIYGYLTMVGYILLGKEL